jgi:hypothetical protein
MNGKQVTIVLAMLAICTTLNLSKAAEVKHRFLAVDESRQQLVYVDQLDSSKDWTLKLPIKHRDIQLVGNNILLLSSVEGFHEYDLTDRRMVKEVKDYPGTVSARRLPDGRTILVCNAPGVTLFELAPDGKVLRKSNFDVPTTRVVRLTPQSTMLFGSGNRVFEGDLDGNILKQHTLPERVWAYQTVRLPSGNLLVCGGYDPRMFEVDLEGKVVKMIGPRQAGQEKDLGLHLLAGFQILKNGHIVVSNWSGHGAEDSRKGVQIVEFDPQGEVVWTWHDPERAGSIDGLIVLDELDTGVLNDDVSSVLGPVTADSYSR